MVKELLKTIWHACTLGSFSIVLLLRWTRKKSRKGLNVCVCFSTKVLHIHSENTDIRS